MAFRESDGRLAVDGSILAAGNITASLSLISDNSVYAGGTGGGEFRPDGNIIFKAGMATLFGGDLGAALNNKQNALGFTPVQQGGGAAQGTNKIYIGWGPVSALRAQVDGTDLGNIWADFAAGGGGGSGWQKFPNGLMIQWGSAVITTDGSGYATIFFANTFPNTRGTVLANYGNVTGGGVLNIVDTVANNGFSFYTAIASTTMRINFFAVGY